MWNYRIRLLLLIFINTNINATNMLGCIKNTPYTSPNYNSTKWYRTSVEKKAIYSQVFNNGYEKINQKVINDNLEKNTWGVILDIDETVLDNTEYQKINILNCDKFNPKTFYKFASEEKSTATSGAVNFTCKIKQLGGMVVFVTNRDGNFDNTVITSTINNLKKVGICFDTVLFAKGVSDYNKNPRFDAVIHGEYNNILVTNKLSPLKIIAYFGDNIQDFPNMFQDKLQNITEKQLEQFGVTYFAFPNPTYGSWEKNKFK